MGRLRVLSLLGLLNFLIVQWSFFRLARVMEGEELVGWVFVGPVWPLTGWWGRYRWL